MASSGFLEILEAVEDGKNILLVGPGGSGKCFDPLTSVLMYDGTVKICDELVAGDLLMGDDSTSRKIEYTHRGIDAVRKKILRIVGLSDQS